MKSELRREIERVKREILETERYQRQKAREDNLYQEWKNHFSSFIAIKTDKLVIERKKLKIIDKRYTDLVSDTEALRRILEAELRERKIRKIYYKSDFSKAINLYFPYIYKTGEFKGEYAKVDIKSCFYSIYSVIGVDSTAISEINLEEKEIEIKAVGKGLLTKETSEVVKLLESEKTLRNTVYGLTRACWLLKLNPSGRHERKYFRGSLQNLDLTVIIASFLHNLVSLFEDKVLYWNIDGGIIHLSGYNAMKEYLNTLGLELRKEVEAEEVIILGLGSYRIGAYETLHFKNGVASYETEKKYLFKVRGAEKIEKFLKGGLKW
ncbi:MAG: hypothetical protein QXG39_06055 [Candidatus Aenigmatarchaeota archaeon]